MIEVEITDNDLDNVTKDFVATVKQVELATKRAGRRSASWLRGQILKQAAKDLRITQGSMKSRFFVSGGGKGDDYILLSIGTLPIPVTKISKPNQTARGVKVGRRSYPGAFVAKIFSGTEKVWIRRGSKHFDPSRYPVVRGRSTSSLPPELYGRFPVVRAAVPIDSVVSKVALSHEPLVKDYFLGRLRHELDYEVNIK